MIFGIQARGVEIFDHQALIDALKGLAYPRNKIGSLLKQGIII